MEHLLSDVGSEEGVLSGLGGVVRTLRRRQLLQHASDRLRKRWCARLLELMRSPRPAVRQVAALLVVESVGQLDEATFSAVRDGWAGTLSSMATQRAEPSSTRLAAANALASLVAVSAAFPAQRREIAPHAPRLLNVLLSVVDRDIPDLPASDGNALYDNAASPEAEMHALDALRILSLYSPQSLRQHHERLVQTLARILLEPTRDGTPPDELARRKVRVAAELLAALPVSCSSGIQYTEAWLSMVCALGGTLHALLRRAFGSVTDRPLCNVILPQFEAKSGIGQFAHGSGMVEQVGYGCVSPLAEREIVLSAATGLVRALHLCLHPQSTVANSSATRGVSGVAGGGSSGSGTGGGAAAFENTPVPVPVRMLCELSLMVLAHDGALPLPAPAADALRHPSLLVIIPELHVLALQLLDSTIAAARRHALPHAESIGDALQLCWRRSSAPSSRSRENPFRCSRLRVAAYELARRMLHSFGGSMAPYMATALVDASVADLLGTNQDCASEIENRRTMELKRAGGGRAEASVDFNDEGGAPPMQPLENEAVKVAAARALHTLHASAASFVPFQARSVSLHCLLLLLEGDTVEASIAASASASAQMGVGTDGATSSLAPPIVPVAVSTRVHAEAIRALHAVISPGEVSPQALARSLAVFRRAQEAASSAIVRDAAIDAIHSLEGLLHPAGVPRWPKPLRKELAQQPAAGIFSTSDGVVSQVAADPLLLLGGHTSLRGGAEEARRTDAQPQPSADVGDSAAPSAHARIESRGTSTDCESFTKLIGSSNSGPRAESAHSDSTIGALPATFVVDSNNIGPSTIRPPSASLPPPRSESGPSHAAVNAPASPRKFAAADSEMKSPASSSHAESNLQSNCPVSNANANVNAAPPHLSSTRSSCADQGPTLGAVATSSVRSMTTSSCGKRTREETGAPSNGIEDGDADSSDPEIMLEGPDDL